MTYLLKVRSGWERPQLRIVQSRPVERQKSQGGKLTSMILTAWAMQASLEFGSEIEHACRWPDPLHWNQLAVPSLFGLCGWFLVLFGCCFLCFVCGCFLLLWCFAFVSFCAFVLSS